MFKFRHLLFAATALVLIVSTDPCRAQQDRQASVSHKVREAWRKSMAQKPLPHGGCFKVEYPKSDWAEVPCGPPSAYVNRRKPHATGNEVGNSQDYVAQATGSNLISSAVGAFSPWSLVSSEAGTFGVTDTKNIANVFMLQMNTQDNYSGSFSTPACNNSSCSGWQQFLFSQTQGPPPGNGQQSVPGVPNSTPALFIEYWLDDWGSSACPSLPSWAPAQPNTPGRLWQKYLNEDCVFNGPTVYVPPLTAADLPDLEMTSSATAKCEPMSSANCDQVTLAVGSALYVYAEPNVLSLAQVWNQVEFNVFGDCCGHQATFSGPTALTVNIGINDASNNAPICNGNNGTTAETNNLTFLGPCATASGSSPAVAFCESLQGAPAPPALGGYRTESSPFVADGYVYFQGSDDKLFKVNVNNPNGDNTWLGGYKAFSSPFVANGYVYFQGSDNKLFKVNVNNPNGDNTWLGGYKTYSSPVVANGYAYFQGSDNKLFKVNVNNPNGDNTSLCGYSTKSSPFVSSEYVYFQGTDNSLFAVDFGTD